MAGSVRRVCNSLSKLYNFRQTSLLQNTCRSTGCIWNVQHVPRNFSISTIQSKEQVTLHFVSPSGNKQTVQADVGESLLDTVVDKNVDLDGFGACEGTLACSTCHLIFTQEQFDKLPDTPTDEELDMLDLAYELTDTSRLGCQVAVSKDMADWEIMVPEGVADARDV